MKGANLAGDPPQSLRHLVLEAPVGHELHADADAQERPPLVVNDLFERLPHACDGIEPAFAVGKGADAGTSEAQTDPEVTETVRGLPKSEGDSGETGQQGRRSGQSPKDGTGKGQGQGRGKGKPDGAPPGTPGGDDDDVIARQLREAAENETDPALRAKLWDEYRRYKDEQN